jgi:hypothetical protein
MVGKPTSHSIISIAGTADAALVLNFFLLRCQSVNRLWLQREEHCKMWHVFVQLFF